MRHYRLAACGPIRPVFVGSLLAVPHHDATVGLYRSDRANCVLIGNSAQERADTSPLVAVCAHPRNKLQLVLVRRSGLVSCWDVREQRLLAATSFAKALAMGTQAQAAVASSAGTPEVCAAALHSGRRDKASAALFLLRSDGCVFSAPLVSATAGILSPTLFADLSSCGLFDVAADAGGKGCRLVVSGAHGLLCAVSARGAVVLRLTERGQPLWLCQVSSGGLLRHAVCAADFDRASDTLLLGDVHGQLHLVSNLASACNGGAGATTAGGVPPRSSPLSTGSSGTTASTKTGVRVSRHHWHSGPVRAAAFVDQYFVSGGDEGVLVVWRTSLLGQRQARRHQEPVRVESRQFAPRLGGCVRAVCASPCLRELGVVLHTGQVLFLDALSLQLRRRVLSLPPPPVSRAQQEQEEQQDALLLSPPEDVCAVVTRDELRFFGLRDDSAAVADARGGGTLAPVRTESSGPFSFSASGGLFAAVFADASSSSQRQQQLLMFQRDKDGAAADFVLASRLALPPALGAVRAVGFHPSRETLLLVSTSRGLSMWAASARDNGAWVCVLSVPLSAPAEVTWSADGSVLLGVLDGGVAAAWTLGELDGRFVCAEAWRVLLPGAAAWRLAGAAGRYFYVHSGAAFLAVDVVARCVCARWQAPPPHVIIDARVQRASGIVSLQLRRRDTCEDFTVLLDGAFNLAHTQLGRATVIPSTIDSSRLVLSDRGLAVCGDSVEETSARTGGKDATTMQRALVFSHLVAARRDNAPVPPQLAVGACRDISSAAPTDTASYLRSRLIS
ncbi:MAG: hypothetical protein MHM6MM_003660 [Cercozoa sp. M6MM]